MSDLPAPMTPAECDLRGFMEWTRFFGERAFHSRWYRAALKDPRGGIAALKLWWTAMLECPAGSLPNDEAELCLMADFGQDIRSWRKHRPAAMHGFVLCADNRWYHPFLAEEAMAAWERRRDKEHEREAWRERQRRHRANGSNANGQDVTRDNVRDNIRDTGECHAGHHGGQTEMSPVTSPSRAGLEEKTREEKKEPPRSPPVGGRTTRRGANSREERIVSGGIAAMLARAAELGQQPDDDLSNPKSYFRLVEGGRD